MPASYYSGDNEEWTLLPCTKVVLKSATKTTTKQGPLFTGHYEARETDTSVSLIPKEWSAWALSMVLLDHCERGLDSRSGHYYTEMLAPGVTPQELSACVANKSDMIAQGKIISEQLVQKLQTCVAKRSRTTDDIPTPPIVMCNRHYCRYRTHEV